MKKFTLLLLLTFVFTCNVFAVKQKEISPVVIGQYKVYPLVICPTEHDPTLFRYKDQNKLDNYKLIRGFNSSAINAFVVVTKGHKILFDAGINAQTITKKLKEINLTPEDIDTICLTHMHYDHIGGLTDNGAKVFPSATIYISQTEADANKNSDLFKIYKDNIKTFADNENILSFIQSEPAIGHTAGHTVFYLKTMNKTLIIWGDILHAPIQFKNPEVYLVYDTNPEQATAVRKELLEKISKNYYYVAGAHLLHDGIGQIEPDERGYKFVKFTIKKY